MILFRRHTVASALLFTAGAAMVVQAQGPIDPAAIVANQQTQTAVLAAQWLHSGDPRTIAWGAFITLRDARLELLPQLRALAAAYRVWLPPLTAQETDEHDAMQATLDAIIQLDQTIPAEAAANLYPEFPVQSMILLSRGGTAAGPFLLQIFRQERGPDAWLAAGNLLLDTKPAGFAAAVLGQFSVEATIRVVDPLGGIGGSRGEGSGGCGDTLSVPPRLGWPAIAAYYFAKEAAPGRVLLSGGPDPAYYVRRSANTGQGTGFGECGSPLDRDRTRSRFLARLIGIPLDDALVRPKVSTMIEWHDEVQYLKAVHAFVNGEQTRFGTLADRLLDRGLLSTEEKGIRPTLNLQISDNRTAATGLPPVQDLPSNVHLGP
jgi:hypothetical protein